MGVCSLTSFPKRKNVPVTVAEVAWLSTNSVNTFILVSVILCFSPTFSFLLKTCFLELHFWTCISYNLGIFQFSDFFLLCKAQPIICWPWGLYNYHLTSFSMVQNGREPWTRLLANCTSPSICFPAVSTEVKLPPFSSISCILCQMVGVEEESGHCLPFFLTTTNKVSPSEQYSNAKYYTCCLSSQIL